MRKRQTVIFPLIALLLAISLTCPAMASSFPDVPDYAAYAEAAECANDMGIMQGDTSGNFNPDKYVTRAQMAAIICRMLGETEGLTTDGSRFTDVPASYWANGYIIKAASLGIINGYQDGSFKPNNTVTYEQALAMFIRAFGADGAANEAGGYPDGYIKIASDSGITADVSAQKGEMMVRWQISMMIYNSFR